MSHINQKYQKTKTPKPATRNLEEVVKRMIRANDTNDYQALEELRTQADVLVNGAKIFHFTD